MAALVVVPNRPDAFHLGRPASQQAPQSPYQAAMKRLIKRLAQRAVVPELEEARGKRRIYLSPEKASRTIGNYLRSLEKFSLWCVASFGRELDPYEVTEEHAYDFAAWMASADPPDIRPLKIKLGLSQEHARVWVELYQQSASQREGKIVRVSAEVLARHTRLDLEVQHKILMELIAFDRSVAKHPPRDELKKMALNFEKPQLDTYSFWIEPKKPVLASSVAAYLRNMSAIWAELIHQGDQFNNNPIHTNVWSRPTKEWERRAAPGQRERSESRQIPSYVFRAIEAACEDGSVLGARDLAMFRLMGLCGLRAEECVSALRKDIGKDKRDRLVLTVSNGKGGKKRRFVVSGRARDALMQLDVAMLSLHSENIQYIAEARSPDAPLIPSMPRFGIAASAEHRWAGEEATALEPLNSKAVYAALERRAKMAMLREGGDKIRRLTANEMNAIHPHGLRHYAATMARKGGMSHDLIAHFLGHSSVDITSRYVHLDGIVVDPGRFVEAAEARTVAVQEIDEPDTQDEPEVVHSRTESFAQIVEPEPVSPQKPALSSESKEVAKKKTPKPTEEAPKQKRKKSRSELERERIEREALEELEVASIVLSREAGASAPIWAYPPLSEDLGSIPHIPSDLEGDARSLARTYRLQKDSSLPWWLGDLGAWNADEAMPVLSPYQIAATGDSAEVLVELRALYDATAKESPTKAAAILQWLAYAIEPVSLALETLARQIDLPWVAWQERIGAQELVLREHLSSAIVGWFAEHGVERPTTLTQKPIERKKWERPIWFFEDDPLLSLPEEERKRARDYVEKLQGKVPSTTKISLSMERLLYLVEMWAAARAGRIDLSKDDIAHTDPEHNKMVIATYPATIEAITRKDFGVTLDLPKLLRRPEKGIGAKLTAEMKDLGVNFERLEMVSTNAVALSSEYLVFNTNNTIHHTEDLKEKFFDAYGTDSECVTRRAVRWLWEQRKKGKPSDKDAANHFDMAMAWIVPCPTAIEEALKARGVPRGAFDSAIKRAALWADAVEEHSRKQGGKWERMEMSNRLAIEQLLASMPQVIERAYDEEEGHASVRPNPPVVPHPVEAVFLARMPL